MQNEMESPPTGETGAFGEKEQEISKPKSKTVWIILAVVIILAIGVGAGYFLTKNNGEKISDENIIPMEKNIDKKGVDPNQYSWSTMKEGPYKDKVSYATGKSLTSWTDSKKILVEHASVPDVVYKDNVLYIYFVDVSKDGIPEQLGLIKSADKGKTWSEKVNIKIDGLGDKVAVDPAPFLLDDGRIRLYYFDISKTMTEGTKDNSMYSAVSSDGINFKEESGVRFKYDSIYDPDVIKVGDSWRMYVGYAAINNEPKVISATSADGLKFEYEGMALDKNSIPNAVFENNTYYLFTGGINISTSKDGKTFTQTSNRFDPGKLAADPGVAKIGEGEYFMVYKTKDFENSQGTTPANPTPNNNPMN